MTQTVLVTGGTGGLGAAVTKRFLDAGWRVVVPWVAERELARVQEHERLTLVQADLFDPAAVAETVAQAGADLRAVVNLVGGFAQHGRVHETPIETFEEQLRLNLRPAYLVAAAAIPRLLDAGGGALVCVSSRAARRPFPGAAGYIVGKAAVLALVDALDAEYRDERIRVNAILPSVIDTPANRAAMPDADFATWVQPAEIAEVVRFLCTAEESGPIGGAHVPVYGRA
ncbi:MAG TPA: SDR family NAD(P)-dependent oxidoreductase [Solirubrobacteraceae bacterium]|nr:SDR family NAD(P)-dependent oxidoreductase [Solirubrobacteraceae bacterium]